MRDRSPEELAKMLSDSLDEVGRTRNGMLRRLAEYEQRAARWRIVCGGIGFFAGYLAGFLCS